MSAREHPGPLFAQPHSPTSLEAAHKARESGLAERGRELVWAALSGAGASGLTDEQLAQITRMNPSSCRPRRIELLRAGRIIESGARPTASGRRAVVWMIR